MTITTNRRLSNILLVTCFSLGLQLSIQGDPAPVESGKNKSKETATKLPGQKSDNSLRQVGYPSFMSPHTNPIAINGNYLFVVNTPSDSVDIIDIRSHKMIKRIPVGIDPVSLAVRPDGLEVWVSNHISDSVSVIDTDKKSSTYMNVVATIHSYDSKTKATTFDEPMGIAFANLEKAYVALSSENQIAVVDVQDRSISKRIKISAQDPRAIKVQGDKLYVIPFESNNKTQLSGGNAKDIDGDLVTFDAWQHSIRVNNVLSIGHVVDIVKHPRVPDRDLYIYDTKTDELVEVVDTLGTLLYGLDVDSNGQVFIAQTDARNEVNGRSGTQKHGLAEMENRAFLNQITRVQFQDGKSENTSFINLEPLPPHHPEKHKALATPFGIQISDDNNTVFVTAAGSDKLVTLDAGSGLVLGRVEVGAVPRGIALENDAKGKASRAWVFNAVGNTVSVVNVSDVFHPEVIDSIALEDPTHPAVKRGRIAFNKAAASTTHTFACASCHPDGHTDQLLWVLKTPVVTGGNQIMPRSTMPIRGLRATEPYHWDGIPGDPYGGNNSANINTSVPPNSDVSDPTTSTRHLIDGGLASTMALVGDQTKNDEGKLGLLSAQERDDMAKFLLNVPYPPAQKRAYTNELSDQAKRGFDLFHIKGDNDPSRRTPNVCGDCHRMPFWVSTNTPGTGMDAPTWRGAYDRFLILPQGRLNIIDFGFYRNVAERGQDERSIWQFSWGGRPRFNPVWNMVLEGSTGQSGAFARQVTLNTGSAKDDQTLDLFSSLEQSASEGAIVLEGRGILAEEGKSSSIELQYHSGSYLNKSDATLSYSSNDLLKLASEGKFLGTFTARHGAKADYDNPQPGIWTLGPIERQSGRQSFPFLYEGKLNMKVSGRHVEEDAHVVVNGRRVDGSIELHDDEEITISLTSLPSQGMHMLQLQNPDGMFSNDFIFRVPDAEQKEQLFTNALEDSISAGNLSEVKEWVRNGAEINRLPDEGGSPIGSAAFRGNPKVVKFLVKNGANVSMANRDGNTPLHVAAFAGHVEVVKYLLRKGANPLIENNNGQTPAEVVSSRWSEQTAGFYRGVGRSTGMNFDLEKIQKLRPQLAELLKSHESQWLQKEKKSNSQSESQKIENMPDSQESQNKDVAQSQE